MKKRFVLTARAERVLSTVEKAILQLAKTPGMATREKTWRTAGTGSTYYIPPSRDRRP